LVCDDTAVGTVDISVQLTTSALAVCQTFLYVSIVWEFVLKTEPSTPADLVYTVNKVLLYLMFRRFCAHNLVCVCVKAVKMSYSNPEACSECNWLEYDSIWCIEYDVLLKRLMFLFILLVLDTATAIYGHCLLGLC